MTDDKLAPFVVKRAPLQFPTRTSLCDRNAALLAIAQTENSSPSQIRESSKFSFYSPNFDSARNPRRCGIALRRPKLTRLVFEDL